MTTTLILQLCATMMTLIGRYSRATDQRVEYTGAKMNDEYERMDPDEWIFKVVDHAELTKGLDPIGASDMLRDLTTFATLWQMRGGEQVGPDELWDEFTESPLYTQYWR